MFSVSATTEVAQINPEDFDTPKTTRAGKTTLECLSLSSSSSFWNVFFFFPSIGLSGIFQLETLCEPSVFLGVKLRKAPHSTAASGSHHQLAAAWLNGPTSSFSSMDRRALLYFCTQTAHPASNDCAQKKKKKNFFGALALCLARKTFFFKNSFTIFHTRVCDWTRPHRTHSAPQNSCNLRRQITKAICFFFFPFPFYIIATCMH